MCPTWTCLLERDVARFSASPANAAPTVLPRAAFDQLIGRRQRAKVSTATRLAGALFEHFRLNDRLRALGCDPGHAPLVLCNRHASWDYIARSTCSDVQMSMDGINNHMATAWFPATVQGYLTIEYANTAQAITLATRDPDLQAAAIDAFFARDPQGRRTGAVVFGTFECLPERIGGCAVSGARAGAFGAVSLVPADADDAAIRAAVAHHQDLYRQVFSIDRPLQHLPAQPLDTVAT